MRRGAAEQHLDGLRTQIASDLYSVRHSLAHGIPGRIPTPFRDPGQDRRLLSRSALWVLGALSGAVAGLVVSSAQQRGIHREQEMVSAPR